MIARIPCNCDDVWGCVLFPGLTQGDLSYQDKDKQDNLAWTIVITEQI